MKTLDLVQFKSGDFGWMDMTGPTKRWHAFRTITWACYCHFVTNERTEPLRFRTKYETIDIGGHDLLFHRLEVPLGNGVSNTRIKASFK